MELQNTLNGIQKEAGFRDSVTKLIRVARGKNVRAAQKQVARIQQDVDITKAFATTPTIGTGLRQSAANKLKELSPLLQAAKHKLQVEKARTSSIRKKIALTAGSAGAIGSVGAIAYKRHKAEQNAEKTAKIEENEVSMNNDLYNICELAKCAADMSIPLEAQPAPEAGSEGVLGMTNNATLSPTSQGASVYASPSEQMQLAKAKQIAACEMAKQAAEDKSRWQSVKDTVGKGYNYVKGKGKAAWGYAKNHPGRVGAGVAGAAALGGTAAYVHNRYRNAKAELASRGLSMDEAVNMYQNGIDPFAKTAGIGDLKAGLSLIGQGIKNRSWKDVKTALQMTRDTIPVSNKQLAYGAGAAAALGGAAYGYKKYKEKQASIYGYDPYADYMDKLASVDYTGIYPEEAAYAMDSAEALYDDCLEKMAYAEELYADAADYLDYCDYMEKQANEFVPIAGSALGSAAGATAGAMIGGRFNAPRIGAGIGAAIGGAVGGPAASALENFVATSRQ